MAGEFEILEGTCPLCLENGQVTKLKMTKIGGVEEFVDGWDVDDTVEVDRLDPTRLSTADRRISGGYGYLEFECPTHGDIFIEKVAGGDWASSC